MPSSPPSHRNCSRNAPESAARMAVAKNSKVKLASKAGNGNPKTKTQMHRRSRTGNAPPNMTYTRPPHFYPLSHLHGGPERESRSEGNCSCTLVPNLFPKRLYCLCFLFFSLRRLLVSLLFLDCLSFYYSPSLTVPAFSFFLLVPFPSRSDPLIPATSSANLGTDAVAFSV